MAYDEGLAQLIREQLEREEGLTERKMFGGLAFMINGNMCSGVVDDALMLRLGPAGHDDASRQPHSRPMDFTGRPLKGMVYVDPPGIESDGDLEAWLGRALSFVHSLPMK